MFLEIKLTALLNARKVKLHKATGTNSKLVDMNKLAFDFSSAVQKHRTLILVIFLCAVLGYSLIGFSSAGPSDTQNVTIDMNGRIEPSTAPIVANGSIFTLTQDLPNCTLHIQYSGITFDGTNHTVYGTIKIENDHVTVENTVINSGGLGILVNGISSVISNNIFFNNLADIQLNKGYATVTDNNDTGGAYMAFYVVSDYNNLTRNSLKEMSVGGNHNTVAENTVQYLENEGKDNIYLNNIVNGTLQTSIPKQTNPVLLWTAIGTALVITVVVASVLLVYFRRRQGKLASNPN